MPCEIIFHRINQTRSPQDTSIGKRQNYRKGYPVQVLDLPLPPGGWGKGCDFSTGKSVSLQILDASADDIKDYIHSSWELEIDYDLIGSNISVDGHRFKIFSTNPGVSGYGNLTIEKIENYLHSWNVDIFSHRKNEIVIDIIIDKVLRSSGFWDMENLKNLSIEEIDYEQNTGIHQYSLDYSNFLSDKNRVKVGKFLRNKILSRNGIIISNDIDNQIGKFSIKRIDVLTHFKSDIYNKIKYNNVLYRRKYYLPENIIDQLVEYSNNNGGQPYSTYKSVFLSLIESLLNKVDE